MPEDYPLFNHRQKRGFWKNHIERWQLSGLSQRAYCRKHELKVHQFYHWRRNILPTDQNDVSFLPVALSDPSRQNHRAVCIHTPNGFIIEFDSHEGLDEISRIVAMVAGI